MKLKSYLSSAALITVACGLCCITPILGVLGLGSFASFGLGLGFGVETAIAALALSLFVAGLIWRRTTEPRAKSACACAEGSGCRK